MFTIRPTYAWTKPGASAVAIHCTPPAGFERTLTGWRIVRPDGATYRPAYPGYRTQAEAQDAADTLNA